MRAAIDLRMASRTYLEAVWKVTFGKITSHKLAIVQCRNQSLCEGRQHREKCRLSLRVGSQRRLSWLVIAQYRRNDVC